MRSLHGSCYAKSGVGSRDSEKPLEDLRKRQRSERGLAFRAGITLGCATGARRLQNNYARRTRRWPLAQAVSTEAAWKPCMTSRGSELPGRLAMSEVKEVITTTLESMPKNATYWSSRALARGLG
jgi:hypothetical protein